MGNSHSDSNRKKRKISLSHRKLVGDLKQSLTETDLNANQKDLRQDLLKVAEVPPPPHFFPWTFFHVTENFPIRFVSKSGRKWQKNNNTMESFENVG